MDAGIRGPGRPNAALPLLGVAYPGALVILFALGGPFYGPFFYSAFILPVLLIAGLSAAWAGGTRFHPAAVLGFVAWVLFVGWAHLWIIHTASAAV